MKEGRDRSRIGFTSFSCLRIRRNDKIVDVSETLRIEPTKNGNFTKGIIRNARTVRDDNNEVNLCIYVFVYDRVRY